MKWFKPINTIDLNGDISRIHITKYVLEIGPFFDKIVPLYLSDELEEIHRIYYLVVVI